MTSTREMLNARKEDIASKMRPLFAKSKDLRTALVETEGQLRELAIELDQTEAALKALDASKAKLSQLTIMQAVLEVLRDRHEGMTAQEILREINTLYFNGSIVRPSLSPQLSRLKDRDRKIELRGNKWFLLPDEPTLFVERRF